MTVQKIKNVKISEIHAFNTLLFIAQIVMTYSFISMTRLGFTSLIFSTLIPSLFILAGIVVMKRADILGIVSQVSKTAFSFPVIMLFGLLLITFFLLSQALTFDLHFPLMILLFVLFITFMVMIYQILSANLFKALCLFIAAFPFIYLAEYWMGINRESFRGEVFFTPTVFFLAALFTGALVGFFKKKHELSKFNYLILAFYFLFLLSGFVSSVLSIDPALSFYEYLTQYVFSSLIFIVVIVCVNSKSKFNTLINYVVFSLLSTILLFGYLFVRYGSGMSSIIDMYSVSLSSGITSGLMGVIILFTYPLILLKMLDEKSRRNMIFITLLFVLMFIFLLTTFSRASLLCFLLGMLMMVFSSKAKETIIFILVCSMMVGGLFFALSSASITNRYLSIFEGFKDSSSIARANAISGSMDMIKDHYLWGIGSGMWDKYVANYVPAQHLSLKMQGGKWAKGYIVDPHSFYLRTYLETGIAGLLSWLMIISLSIIYVAKLLKNNWRNRSKRDLAAIFGVFLTTIIVYQLIDYRFVSEGTSFMISIFFWISFGSLLRMNGLAECE